MSSIDVFSTISAHMIEGIMMHHDLCDYFDFLNLHGFKRLHEYRYMDETAELRGIHRYFINHYNMLLNDIPLNTQRYIPNAWYQVYRNSVAKDAKEEATKTCFNLWVGWEQSSKKLYEKCYIDLYNLTDIAGTEKVDCLIKDVDRELKCADRMLIQLQDIDYDLSFMVDMQEELHEKYKKKLKKIGVKLC